MTPSIQPSDDRWLPSPKVSTKLAHIGGKKYIPSKRRMDDMMALVLHQDKKPKLKSQEVVWCHLVSFIIHPFCVQRAESVWLQVLFALSGYWWESNNLCEVWCMWLCHSSLCEFAGTRVLLCHWPKCVNTLVLQAASQRSAHKCKCLFSGLCFGTYMNIVDGSTSTTKNWIIIIPCTQSLSSAHVLSLTSTLARVMPQ